MSGRLSRRLGLAWLCAVFALSGLLAVGAQTAGAARGHIFSTTFGEAGSGDGQLNQPQGIAVDEATGDVYVADMGNNRVEYFDPKGEYAGQFNGSGTLPGEGREAPSGQFSSPNNVAVDNSCVLHKPALNSSTSPTCEEFDPSNGDVYVVDLGHKAIVKYSASGAYIGQLTEANGEPFGPLDGVAVDTTGHVWVYQQERATRSETTEVSEFTNALENQFVVTVIPKLAMAWPGSAFAVDSHDNLYPDLFSFVSDTNVIAETNSVGEAISEGLDYEPASGVAVEFSNDGVYVDNGTTVARFNDEKTLLERIGAGHLTSGSGVGVNSARETVYVADASTNDIEVYEPEPPGTPTVESESFANVTSEVATLLAEVNPRGAATTYRFEYGVCASLAACPSASYEASVPAPAGSLRAGWTVTGLSIEVEGLRIHTPYHFRIVAENAYGITDGPEESLTTQTTGGSVMLPDGRQWEMVSPPDKMGAPIFATDEVMIKAAAVGNAITYTAANATEADPQGNSNAMQIISRRGASGWSSHDIDTAHKAPTAAYLGGGQEYRLFSEDLWLGLVEPFEGLGFTPLSPEATERTEYIRHDNLCESTSSECYVPLVTANNTPPGTKFGPASETQIHPWALEQVIGATPDLSHVIIDSSVALTTTPIVRTGLYEWSDGKLQLISIMPEAEGDGAARDAVLGSDPYTREEVNPVAEETKGTVSRDGSRIVWSADERGWEPHLYMRDMMKGETVRLSPGAGEGVPVGMSADGSKVFFIEGGALYECDVVEVGAKLSCQLKDLALTANPGESAELGGVLGVSEDGSYVYFTAGSALAQSAKHGSCDPGTIARSGVRCNLYVEHNGQTKFIAELSNRDLEADVYAGLARVSADGNWLTFMSNDNLTSYDTRDAMNGRPDEEVYLYNAVADRLVCASCNPTGARPVGVATTNIAASLPSWNKSGSLIYQPRYLSNSGRLFFSSHEALVPQDVNGTQDVYEWEPAGVGDCSESTVTFDAGSGGCANLVSAGSSKEESTFLDASETGGDVFFTTTASLAVQDYDTAIDVYDAHECRSDSPCFPVPPPTPPPCSSGDACKAAPSPQPQIFGAPPSQTFSGTGNLRSAKGKQPVHRSLTRAQKLTRALKACRRQRSHRRRVACERHVRSRYLRIHFVTKSGR